MSVALVRPAQTDELLAEATTRLRAELRAAGFDVRELLAVEGEDPRRQVESSQLEPAPVATLAILGVDGAAAADIWLADRLTRKTVVRHVDVSDVARRRAPSVLAVRAVELLRASLLEATTREPTDRDRAAPPVPRDVARWMAPRSGGETKEPSVTAAKPKAEVRGELGVAILYGLRGLAPAFAPLVRIEYGNAGWSGRASIVAPALGGDVTRHPRCRGDLAARGHLGRRWIHRRGGLPLAHQRLRPRALCRS